MQIRGDHHLTYCSNIHPGESWDEVFNSLRQSVPVISRELGVQRFGLGLRLSREAASELHSPVRMDEFRRWMEDSGTYVFTLNGFPYGGFHNKRVKDNVHRPDWLTGKRLEYTRDLFGLLSRLLPEGLEGGISTSPVSYRHWHTDRELILEQSVEPMMKVVTQLHNIKLQTGQTLHLDIEPEPDGMLETTEEFVEYFNNHLLTTGKDILQRQGMSDPEEHIRDHIRLCYDVCHFAVEYETPAQVISAMASEGIGIGKLQISAALKALKEGDWEDCRPVLSKFDEPTYLHQAVLRTGDKLQRYMDLDQALGELGNADELRTHFHVPVFVEDYGKLRSTQEDIREALKLWREQPYTSHLEVETYTWTVLPPAMKLPLELSIVRELDWIKKQLL